MSRARPRPIGEQPPTKAGGRLRHFAALILWWALSGIVIALIAGYFVLGAVDHARPPIVAVEGGSMRPTLVTGDIVVLEGVSPSRLHVGDVIAVNVPPASRQQYGLPPHVVHRIVKLEHTPSGLVFVTKGDANAGDDVFQTFPDSVVGKVKYQVPDAGYPILFLTSRQGEIFLGVVAFIILVYFLLGVMDSRRAERVGTSRSVESVRAETAQLKELIERLVADDSRGREADSRADHAGEVRSARMIGPARAPLTTRAGEAASTNVALPPTEPADPIGVAVVESLQRSAAVEQRVEALTEAISEYALHLQSHTSAVQHLAVAAAHLDEVASGLAAATRPDATPAPEGPPPGWYEETLGGRSRWWDGTRWTEHVYEAPPPPAAADQESPRVGVTNSWDRERWNAYLAWTEEATEGPE